MTAATHRMILLKRWGHFLVATLFYVAIYFPLSRHVMGQHTPWLPVFQWETQLELLPSAIYAYLLVYVVVQIPLYVISPHEPALFNQYTRRFYLLTLIHFIFFLALPSAIERPTLPHTDGVTMAVLRFYYDLDPPRCIFPSLHVTYGLIATLILWNHRRGWALVCAAMTFAISVAVLLVKQHFAIDVVAAYLVTGLIWGLWPRKW